MIVEMLGIPGSGKSTYVNKWLKNHIAINPLNKYLYNKSRVRQNINKITLILYYVLRNFREFYILSQDFNKIKFSSIKSRIKMFLYLFSIISIIEKVNKQSLSDTVIIDEGINQVIWGILYNSENSENEIFTMYSKLSGYIASEVKVIVVPKDTIKDRLLSRDINGGSELQLDIRESDMYLDLSINYLKVIVEKLVNLEECTVTFVNMDSN